MPRVVLPVRDSPRSSYISNRTDSNAAEKVVDLWLKCSEFKFLVSKYAPIRQCRAVWVYDACHWCIFM